MYDTQVRPEEVRSQLQLLRAARPHVRMRDAATDLGLSEAELVAAFCGHGVTRLAADWRQLVPALSSLGPVMALTRNPHAVIEKTGPYERIEIDGGSALVLGAEIDLRLFLGRWHSAFAVDERPDTGMRRSLQFFDPTGVAVHKVFLTEHSDVQAHAALTAQFASVDQAPRQSVTAAPAPPAVRPDEAIDVAQLRREWEAMQDTHEFFAILHRCGVGRLQALRLIGDDLARQVSATSLRAVLDAAARDGLPIMVFVGNAGAVQIHTGPVYRIQSVGQWLNVLDPDFNLHVDEPAIASAWVVHKPTVDGTVTALELYDATGETIALLFGKRKPGIAQLPEWRALADGLPT